MLLVQVPAVKEYLDTRSLLLSLSFFFFLVFFSFQFYSTVGCCSPQKFYSKALYLALYPPSLETHLLSSIYPPETSKKHYALAEEQMGNLRKRHLEVIKFTFSVFVVFASAVRCHCMLLGTRECFLLNADLEIVLAAHDLQASPGKS